MTKILLVDDVSEIHEQMHVYLKDIKDRQIVDVFSGPEAMQVLGLNGMDEALPHPDVILLDIEMPGMDGLELCRKIRDRDEYKKTPIIFLTQHHEIEYQTHAMEAGATGYLTKPLPRDLVNATIENVIKTKQLNDAIETLIDYKTGLTSMLVHDINNYLGTILLNVDLGLLDTSSPEKTMKRLQTVRRGMLEIQKMTSGLLDIEKLESKTLPLKLAPVDGWNVLFERASHALSDAVRQKINVRVFNPKVPTMVMADTQVVQRIFDNLLQNATKFAPVDSVIDIGAYAGDGFWKFVVENDGPGIEKKFHKKIFEKYMFGSLLGARAS